MPTSSHVLIQQCSAATCCKSRAPLPELLRRQLWQDGVPAVAVHAPGDRGPITEARYVYSTSCVRPQHHVESRLLRWADLRRSNVCICRTIPDKRQHEPKPEPGRTAGGGCPLRQQSRGASSPPACYKPCFPALIGHAEDWTVTHDDIVARSVREPRPNHRKGRSSCALRILHCIHKGQHTFMRRLRVTYLLPAPLSTYTGVSLHSACRGDSSHVLRWNK